MAGRGSLATLASGGLLLGILMLISAPASVLSSSSLSSSSVGGSRCMQAMYDFVRTGEGRLKEVWGMSADQSDSSGAKDYPTSSGNCVNNTDFWQIRVLGHKDRPMSKSSEWFGESENCRPFKKNEVGAQTHLKMDRNPADHWKESMLKLKQDSMVRIALINQHERDPQKAAAEQRHCKGAHATSFYVRPGEKRVYQLPAAWVNMYTVKEWVDSLDGRPFSMSYDDFFGTLRVLFQVHRGACGKGSKECVTACEKKWAAFKKIFMPPKGRLKKDFSSWAIPPVFAKLEYSGGSTQITQSTTCASVTNEWYTEPNEKWKSPYWRDIIFIVKPFSEADCVAKVEKIWGKKCSSSSSSSSSKGGRRSLLAEAEDQPSWCGKGAEADAGDSSSATEADAGGAANAADGDAAATMTKHHPHHHHAHHHHHLKDTEDGGVAAAAAAASADGGDAATTHQHAHHHHHLKQRHHHRHNEDAAGAAGEALREPPEDAARASAMGSAVGATEDAAASASPPQHHRAHHPAKHHHKAHHVHHPELRFRGAGKVAAAAAATPAAKQPQHPQQHKPEAAHPATANLHQSLRQGVSHAAAKPQQQPQQQQQQQHAKQPPQQHQDEHRSHENLVDSAGPTDHPDGYYL